MTRVVQRDATKLVANVPGYRDMPIRLDRGLLGSKHPAGEHAL
jgi:hypothetical protein